MTWGLLAAALLSGASFAPDTTNAPSCTRMVPVNCRGYQLKFADAAEKPVFFSCLPDDPNTLIGPRPWVGSVTNRGQVIRVFERQREGQAVRAGMMFHRGQILGFTREGVDYVYPRGDPTFSDSLADLWPRKAVRETTKGSKGDIWQGPGQRCRLWFANPNSAGFLGAELALLFLFLTLKPGIGRKVVGAAGTLGGVLIVAFSSSRGAMVALVVGAAALACVYGRELLTRKGQLTVAACVVAAIALLGVTGRWSRVAGTFTRLDAGNGLRVKVAKASAQMFADAPFGWHGGEVPGRSACLNWYVADERHGIRTHFLTMAELGWFGGGAYLFFWALMVCLGARLAGRGNTLPLALWASFGVAGLFNPVYTEWELWILPAAVIGWVGYRRGKLAFSRRVLMRLALLAVLLAVAGVAAFAACGAAFNRGRKISVASSGAATLVNGRNPEVWIVEDIPVLGGWNGFPGRDILWQYARQPALPALGYVYDVEDLPQAVDCLVLPGRAAEEYLAAYAADPAQVCHARRVLFLSPSISPEKVPLSLSSSCEILWLSGKYLVYRDEGYWKGLPWVRVVSGAEQYIPNWLSKAFGHFSQTISENNNRRNPNGN